MKYVSKIMLSILLAVLLLVLVFFGVAAWDWYNTDETNVPSVAIAAMGQEVSPAGYDWSIPLLGGLFDREFSRAEGQAFALGVSETPELPLSLPGGYASEITVVSGGRELFQGPGEKYAAFVFPGDGEYAVSVSLTREKLAGAEYGSFFYAVEFTVKQPPKEPEISVSGLTLSQGGVLGVEVVHIPEGVTPVLETELGATVFQPDGEGRMVAYLGAAYNREAGDYPLIVRCGEREQTYSIRLTEGQFERQDLTIDVSDPVISEANSPAAYAQYRAAIYPLYETFSEEKYWSGSFILPVEGARISTPYGIKRYTNGAKEPSRHAGTDFAIAKGTPVKAPAAGKVVFSQYLLNTGNTIAVEHGGGLKTIYFHMEERKAEEGAAIEQGQVLGLVGTTGYSTGPHLHFELRLGSQSVNPWEFFDGNVSAFF